jgi:DNA modification methylase
MQLGPYILGPTDDEHQGIYTGDARELAKAIPDESVDLIFTDPVYDRIDDYRWLAETAARVLKPDRACCAYYGIGYLPETVAALSSELSYRWQGLWYQSNNDKQRGGFGFVVYSPFLWMDKGRTKVRHKTNDVVNVPIPNGNHNHEWSKQPGAIDRYVKALTDEDDIAVDFFTGGGTVPAVCKMLGRHWLAFEIDPATADTARERVRNTQPPLFVPQPEQMTMEV